MHCGNDFLFLHRYFKNRHIKTLLVHCGAQQSSEINSQQKDCQTMQHCLRDAYTCTCTKIPMMNGKTVLGRKLVLYLQAVVTKQIKINLRSC